jgi:hypothetical protein
MTKKQIKKTLKESVLTFIDELGFKEQETDNGYSYTCYETGNWKSENCITFYATDDPYILIGPGYSNYKASDKLLEAEKQIDIYIKETWTQLLEAYDNSKKSC